MFVLSCYSNTRRLPAVVTYKDRSVTDPADKAALFNTFFSTVYASNAISSGDLNDDVVHPNPLMKISTTQEEASGVDGIPARILKIYAKELSWPLTHLFNLSFTLGEVPLIWKRANITPVFKANAKEKLRKTWKIIDQFLCRRSWANVRRELSTGSFTLMYHHFLIAGSMVS